MECVELTAQGFEIVEKLFRDQIKFNITLIAFGAIYIYMANKKFNKLSNELEELKQTRGE